jgi:hypothetical protein
LLTILGITGPIFLIVGVGFAAVRHGLLTRAEMRPLGVFVINVALPALLFKAMSARALGDLVDGHLLLIYALGSLLAAGLALAVSCLLRGRSLQVGAVQALGASMSNSAFIGYPIALQAMGPLAGSALAVYALVEGLLMMPLLLTLAEVAGSANRRWSAVLREILRRLTRNPFILAMGAGVLWTLLGVPLPVPVAKAVDMLSVASAPVALFCIGGTLAGLSLRGMAGDLSLIVAGKLLVHPLCVAAVLAVSPGSRPELATAAILNAGMPMLSIYPLLSQKFGQEGLSAAALVAATTLSFFTVSGLLWVLGT